MDDEEVEAYTAMKEVEAETATAEAEKEIVIIEDEPVPGSTGNIAKVPETKEEPSEPDPAVVVGTVLIVALMLCNEEICRCHSKQQHSVIVFPWI